MAPSFLTRLRTPAQSDAATDAADDAPPPPPRRAIPPVGQMRRERRALLREREERIRDLGGVVLEMIRRDDFRQDLVYEQAAELMSLDDRVYELESLLSAATTVRRAPAVRCECGAPVPYGSHFCGNCGRPVGQRAIIACSSCGHALPADAKFCAACGAPAGSDAGAERSGDA
jgi:hypothetical protein